MSKSSSMALAIGAGYLLGRKHKLRMAALLAAAAATGSAGGMAGRALRSGGQLLTSPQVLDKLPPEAAKVAGLVRSDLAQAGKAAAQAAVSSRVDSLTSALYERADAVRSGQAAASEPADDDELADEAGHDAEDDRAEDSETDDEQDVRPRARERGRPDRTRERPAERARPERRRRAERGADDARDRPRKSQTRDESAPVRRTGR